MCTEFTRRVLLFHLRRNDQRLTLPSSSLCLCSCEGVVVATIAMPRFATWPSLPPPLCILISAIWYGRAVDVNGNILHLFKSRHSLSSWCSLPSACCSCLQKQQYMYGKHPCRATCIPNARVNVPNDSTMPRKDFKHSSASASATPSPPPAQPDPQLPPYSHTPLHAPIHLPPH